MKSRDFDWEQYSLISAIPHSSSLFFWAFPALASSINFNSFCLELSDGVKGLSASFGLFSPISFSSVNRFSSLSHFVKSLFSVVYCCKISLCSTKLMILRPSIMKLFVFNPHSFIYSIFASPWSFPSVVNASASTPFC